MGVQQNYAKFDSRVAEAGGDAGMYNYPQEPLADAMYSTSNTVQFLGGGSSHGYGLGGVEYILGSLFGALLIFVCVMYFLFLMVTLFKKGADAMIHDISTRITGLWNWLKRTWNRLWSWKIRHIFNKAWKNILFWVLILTVLCTAKNILQGNSSLLVIDRIPQGTVGVNLEKDAIIQPGIYTYSPLLTSYFLSPTNTFDFEIAEVTANTNEDLSVSLDWRVGFIFNDDQRLAFYKQFGAKNIRAVSSDIVMPALLESIKKVIQTYSFKELSAQSDKVKAETMQLAQAKLAEKGITLQYLNIIDIRLPKSYLTSQEDLLKAENERMLAEAALETQKKQAEKKLLEAENDKAVKIIEAQSIAEYNRIVNEQTLSNSAIELRRIELEAEKIDKWDGKLPATVEGGFAF